MGNFNAWQNLNGKSYSDTAYSITNMNEAKENYSIIDMNGVSRDLTKIYGINNMNGKSCIRQ